MKIDRKILLLALAAAIMAVTFIQSQIHPQKENSLMKSYTFLLADTKEKRNAGLSDKDSLPADTVLLFSYGEDGKCSIWMKDMKFSIDVVWLDDNFTVVDLKEGLSPDTYPQAFSPISPCRYFIEAEEGFIRTNNIRIDDKVSVDFTNSLLNF